MGGTTPTSAYAQTGLTGSGGLGGAGTSFYGGSAFGMENAIPSMGGGQFDWTNAFSGTPATPAAPAAATPTADPAPTPPAGQVRETNDPNSVNYNTFLPALATPTAPTPAPAPAAPQGGPLNPTPDYLRSLGWVPVGPFGIWQSPDGMSTMNLGTGDPTFPNAAAQYGGMGSMGARR